MITTSAVLEVRAALGEVLDGLGTVGRLLELAQARVADAAAVERAGQDALRRALHSGPETSLHVLGWWRGAQRLKNTLTMGAAPDDVGCWVAFDIQGQELGALAPGQLVSWSPRPARGLFFDRSVHARPEVLIVPEVGR